MALLDKFRKKQKEKQEIKSVQTGRVSVPEEKIVDAKLELKKFVPTNKKHTAIAYRIIKEPHITEKATDLTGQNKYIFNVYPNANKPEIRKAIKALYNVSVKNVNLIHLPPKRRRLGRTEGWRHGRAKGYKKAIVTLAKGGKIEIMPR